MITQIKTGSREEWLELRKKYIGGSDASAVIGANPYRSAYALWAEKSSVPGEWAPFFEKYGILATMLGNGFDEEQEEKAIDFFS